MRSFSKLHLVLTPARASRLAPRRLIGAIGKLFSLVSLYAGAITLATVVEIASGIYVIYQLFHGEGASDVSKCEQNAGDGVNEQFTHFACSSSFKVGRAIVVVIYVLFWLFIICECARLSSLHHCAVVECSLGGGLTI